MTKQQRNIWRKLKPSQIAIARGVLLFLLFFILNLVWENRTLYEPDGESCEPVKADETPPFYDWIYPKLTTLLMHKEHSGKVVIVYIPETLDEVQQNLCRGRLYLAALTELLTDSSRPAAIVIDKYFSRHTCNFDEGEKNSTASLLAAVKKARESGIAVIVGEPTGNATHREHGTCLTQVDGFFNLGAISGLTKLNANREQIPLRWSVLPSIGVSAREQGNEAPKALDPPKSLALVTVENAPSALAEAGRKKLPIVLASSRQPYAKLDIESSAEVPSTVLLCSAKNCGASSGTSALKATPDYRAVLATKLDVENKIVIIGSQNSADSWGILGERRWGYQLQAAYIEALLSGNYLRAVPAYWIVCLSVLFILLLEAVPLVSEYACRFEACKHKQLLTKLSDFWFWVWIWPITFIFLVFSVCVILGFLPPLSVLIEALVVMAGRILFDRMDYFQKHMAPEAKETRS